MNINKLRVLIILMLFIVFTASAFARTYTESVADKKFDASEVHNLGNIWLRVSNYGFFGSGGEQWPSLEYPGGSSVDYLFYGGLWFGAKKVRRDHLGREYYWLNYPPEEDDDCVLESDSLWNESLHIVVDTLTSIGIDGYYSINELLPAYNPLEASYLGTTYTAHNYQDRSVSASIREQRKGVDDDNDGLIDEDPTGYAFPFRVGDELPDVFQVYGGDWLHYSEGSYGTDIITDEDNQSIWYPLGFVDLSDDTNEFYNFAEPNDDDGDGIVDEDGYPVSEQDFISYYFDYSPFENGNPDQDRDYGASSSTNNHVPLNIRIRQMSYQWSYDYIKNLVYVEFDITNMNPEDTLYDCAMGIYMDSDVGPQSFGGSAIAPDDLSSYVRGEGYEFAYTYDADQDGGLTTGYVGSRVCTPDPDELEFVCWTYDLGNTGPNDWQPLNYATTANLTANEKYWLLTGRNANPSAFFNLREYPNYQIDNFPGGTDTRYLFGFYGAQSHTGDTDNNGILDYLEVDENGVYFKRWNLAPGRTMKIVIAVFPGDSVFEISNTARFAKFIYGKAQTLTTVVEPDLEPHYQAPEPPDYPKMYAGLINDGNALDLYWDNISEYTIDPEFVPPSNAGWQIDFPGLDSYVPEADTTDMPEKFLPSVWGIDTDTPENRLVNPWTADRLRHDFQGYTLYGRSGSGSQEDWVQKDKWDKYETDQDYEDYQVNAGDSLFINYQGELGIGTYAESLPNRRVINEEDEHYFHLSEQYILIPYEVGVDDYVFGEHIYDYTKTKATADDEVVDAWSEDDKALYFANPNLLALPNGDDIYLELYSKSLIPLEGFISDNIFIAPNSDELIEEIRVKRLSRRYYNKIISHPPKGIEYYVAVTTWDRGYPSEDILSLESGKDADANMKILFPGPSAKSDMENIYVVPNPYIGQSKFDGRIEKDYTGDRSRRIWFANLPEDCTIKIYTLAGDLVDKVVHHGGEGEDIVNPSVALNQNKLKQSDITATGMEPWDMLSHNNQIIAAGIYLFSVKDHDSGDIKVGKFVIIK
ncbi:MAG: hypothetical protein J7K29_00770 [Candidatus Cloacimonetes bacterium]|nr:hypothetical protein [Candidatus Cloacimonadota bacterium]